MIYRRLHRCLNTCNAPSVPGFVYVNSTVSVGASDISMCVSRTRQWSVGRPSSLSSTCMTARATAAAIRPLNATSVPFPEPMMSTACLLILPSRHFRAVKSSGATSPAPTVECEASDVCANGVSSISGDHTVRRKRRDVSTMSRNLSICASYTSSVSVDKHTSAMIRTMW